ncbi:MAG: sigma-70 family RNA polymerase sigma factor [Thermoleophilia bacterium]|nr:sigma-70 family RNA polymerase sigma factor [Thermoleophilia bacterium]
MHRESFTSTLEAARANADWAWRELYDSCAPRLLQYLRSQGAPDPDATLGETFLHVVRGIHGFSGDEDAFRGWVYRIAQRCLIDARRTHRASSELPEDEPSSAPDVASDVEARADEARVYQMLRALPRDQRAVVFMRIGLELPFAEIAVILGRRESAVKMLQQRALRTLRERGLGADRAAQPLPGRIHDR